MRYFYIVLSLIGGMSSYAALANESSRLEFNYFRPINQAQATDFANPVNIIKYHGIYDKTYEATYTGLFGTYQPKYEMVLTLADNHESLKVKYDNQANNFSKATVTALEGGDYIVSYEKLPLKSHQSPLVDKRYIKTFDISGEFLRTAVDGKPATLATSFTNYHALPKVLKFPAGSKCYQWYFHESMSEFYEFNPATTKPSNIKKLKTDLKTKTPSNYFGQNNRVAIYPALADSEMFFDYELGFYYHTIYNNKYYHNGIKFTPKNSRAIDNNSCTYLNPTAADYIEGLLKAHKDEIIKPSNP